MLNLSFGITCNVDSVKGDKDQSFVPLHSFIVDDAYKNCYSDSVGETVSRQWPPVQGHHLHSPTINQLTHDHEYFAWIVSY